MRALLMMLALWLAPSWAWAQEESGDVVVAAEAFRAGEAAYARGDFEVAARSFEVAHRLAPHVRAAYNIGLAWQAAGDQPRAADAFAAALALGGLGDQQQADAERRLAELRADLGVIAITGPAGTTISVAHLQKRVVPVDVHVKPGEHTVAIALPDGRALKRTVSVAAGGQGRLSIEPPPRAAAPRARPAPPPDPVPDTSSTRTAHLAGGIVALGLAAIIAGVSIGTGVAALDARDAFDESGHRDADAHDRAATLRTVTNVGWAVAGALAVTGVVVLVTMPSDEALGVTGSLHFRF